MIIRAVRDNLVEMPEHLRCETAAFALELVKKFRRVRRYQYEMTEILYPKYVKEDLPIDYGIIEEKET